MSFASRWDRLKGMDARDLPTGFDEKHGNARYTSAFSWLARFVLLFLAIIVAWSAVLGYWMLRPYDEVTLGPRGPIQTEEFTTEGVPVVRVGQAITYEQPFCNEGPTDTRVERWLDVYGAYVGFDPDTTERSVSFDVPGLTTYGAATDPDREECIVVTSRALIPDYIYPGAVYALRLSISYDPNPVRTVVINPAFEDSHLFLYLPEGAPIP